MALEGTLQDFALVDILQLIGMQRKTGTLTLSRKEQTITVVLQDGNVVWASPSDDVFESRLGRILVHRGLIAKQRWDEARQLQARKGQPLIPFLLEAQWISPRDCERVVQREALETIYRALRWGDGKYSFNAQERVNLSRGQIPPVGTETILLEAVRQIDEWPLVEQRIQSLDMVVRRSSKSAYREQVAPEGLDVLELVDGKRSAREIAELSDVAEFDVYKAIADLLAAGALELEKPAETTQAARAARVPRKLPSWVYQGALAAIALVSLGLQFAFGYDPLYLLPSRHSSGQAEIQARKFNLAEMEIPRGLDLYLLLRGRYPDTLEQLGDEGLLTGRLHDPWGRPWVYEQRQSTYRLVSRGPDGRIGTPDDLHISPSN
ncbi:MAG: DUF4388 domain-containing protein [Candidatus Methylomirabilales bacterium]